MPRQETRTLYTLDEMRTIHPNGYEKICERWINQCRESSYVPWSDEIMDSLKAVMNKCDAKLTDWKIGPWSPSFVTIRVDDEYQPDDDSSDPLSAEPSTLRKDSEWFYETILRPLGYNRCPERGVEFPGLCPLTGVCFDDDMLQHVYERLARNESLTEALESLAGVASRMMESECEAQENEENMHANWGDLWFTEDGKEA